MRYFKALFLWMVLPSLLIAPGCEDSFTDPEICYQLSIKKEGEILQLTPPYTVDAGRQISFTNCGKADFYAFFSGTPGHVWEDFNNPADTVTVGSDTKADGSIDYTYQNPGTYTATFVLNNRKFKEPLTTKQGILELAIEVTEAIEE
jgi:hypothetical protein